MKKPVMIGANVPKRPAKKRAAPSLYESGKMFNERYRDFVTKRTGAPIMTRDKWS